MSQPSQTEEAPPLRAKAHLAVAGKPASAASGTNTQCELSVVIKALNEERNIERTLRAALTAVEGVDAEVILADSLSSDATVSIAKQFPVTIVQLVHGEQRCCGIGAQLGYQHARGQWILIIDGDMEVDRAWLLAAIRHMHTHPDLAGVGGMVTDINLENIEFRARQQRKPTQPGDIDRLYGGGLYRRKAIEQVGYLTHRSLHACEELELGLRLTAAGWRMQRMDMESIRHHGHTVPMWTLIRRRWRSSYVNGSGDLLRASMWRPWFWRAVACQALPLVVIVWWLTMLALAVAASIDGTWLSWLAAVVLLPIAMMLAKKRSVALGLYSILMWCVESAGLLRGLSSRPLNPEAPIDSRVLQMEPHGQRHAPELHVSKLQHQWR